MMMWLRIGGALALTLAVVGGLDFLGAVGRPDVSVEELSHGRLKDLFWFAIFAVVMATALLAAARRSAEQMRHALARVRR